MLPLKRMPVEKARNVSSLFFDLDGTFITGSSLSSRSILSLEKIRDYGIKTIAVTGRPAGWCDLIARWWPVDSVVGENGAFSYSKKEDCIHRMSFHDSEKHSEYRNRLDLLFQELQSRFPDIKLASDQQFRLWDLAIDIAEESKVSMETSLKIVKYCRDKGARAEMSNIHVNIWFGDYNKENMSLRVLEDFGLKKESAVYVGDSPNDSPMFRYFDLSVGVNSVMKYRDIMQHHPIYVTQNDGSKGFVELVEYIISTK